MWKTWKESGEDPEHMEPLLKSLQPLVQNRVRTFAGRVPISREVLNAEATRKTIRGLRRYDPTKAQMHTFLTHELKGLKRYVVQQQNLSRITEDRANKVGDYLRAQSSLREELSREPTSQEIADRMRVSVQTVTLLSQELREDLLDQPGVESPFINETPRSRGVLRLIPYELTPNEMLVFEYATGYGGKPKITSTGEIAKRLGWSDSKVSQTKRSIAKKMEKYL